MESTKKIKSALVSVYNKEGLQPLISKLADLNVKLFSTGGTLKFIRDLGFDAIAVEDLTGYPEVFGGRVKTLHPAVFGGILNRRSNETDVIEKEKHQISDIDLVIVDLYPFEETVASGAGEEDIIEKIDIGGISLIRAAAKNFNDVTIVASKNDYSVLLQILDSGQGSTTLAERRRLAASAFAVSSGYDTAIFNYFNQDEDQLIFRKSVNGGRRLRYGENPHQKGVFYGDLDALFERLGGKELSYNNLLDIDAAISLMNDFDETTFAILKHNNACGLASRADLAKAYLDALAGDPLSAFGGVLISNAEITKDTAAEINKLFFEVIIAPSFDTEAMALLKTKSNRIVLRKKPVTSGSYAYRTILNGVLEQEKDLRIETPSDLKAATKILPTASEISDLLFANKIVKHTKSNTIVLARDKQLLASGTGQTSRVDALRQAIAKARTFGFDLNGAVMASDAFFPFPDCVQIAHEAGIRAVIQPGGSIKDKESIDFCNANKMSMVMTGTRHFRH